MHEIEVKILEVDVDAVVKRLEELGAVRTREGAVRGSYFTPPGGYKDGTNLRLRDRAGVVELTLKKPISREGAKIMDEKEVVVDDYGKARDILLALGYEESRGFVKHRVSYSKGPVHYEFDTWPGIPTYLEIEAPDMDALKGAVEELGFSMADTKPWSGKDVLKHYGK